MAENRNARRTLKGTVVKKSSTQTIVVMVERTYKHPRYGKYVRKQSKYMAHDPADTAVEDLLDQHRDHETADRHAQRHDDGDHEPASKLGADRDTPPQHDQRLHVVALGVERATAFLLGHDLASSS